MINEQLITEVKKHLLLEADKIPEGPCRTSIQEQTFSIIGVLDENLEMIKYLQKENKNNGNKYILK